MRKKKHKKINVINDTSTPPAPKPKLKINHVKENQPFPYINSYNNDYCEIFYASHDQKYTGCALIIFISIAFLLLITTPIILILESDESGLIFVKLLILLLDLFVILQIYAGLRISFSQPPYQPIVFHRAQKKVYIYNFYIPFSFNQINLGLLKKKLPKEPKIIIWDFDEVTFYDSYFLSGGGSKSATLHTYKFFITNTKTREKIQIDETNKSEGLIQILTSFDSSQQTQQYRQYTNWFIYYMTYKDEFITNPPTTLNNRLSNLWPMDLVGKILNQD